MTICEKAESFQHAAIVGLSQRAIHTLRVRHGNLQSVELLCDGGAESGAVICTEDYENFPGENIFARCQLLDNSSYSSRFHALTPKGKQGHFSLRGICRRSKRGP